MAVSEQGTGGPVERSRRQLSTSAPCPTPEPEPIQDPDVQMQPQPQDKEKSSQKKKAPSSQESPRRCLAAPRATSASSTSSSSSTCSMSSTSSSETCPSSRSSETSVTPSWPAEPPVTRSTLSELDVSKIIHNPKLRHDINFDPELHFRPNLDGEKGRRKQERANQFWRTLKKELTEFTMDRPSFYAKHGEDDDWTLPALLRAVKDIIQTLVPQRDRQLLEEGLNVELLMQQFHKGVADLEKLALWLSRVLKSHCAPMRDDWVDTMYAQLSSGNRNLDLDELVTGMRSLLSVLEAMKLDVANHQIRCLRPVLIEDTTHFEQKFFYKKMESGKIDISLAKQWYQDAEEAQERIPRHPSRAFGEMGIFFEAVSQLILPSAGEKRVPNTFLFDEERIAKLRVDVLDAINLEVCMRMYEDIMRESGYGSLDFTTTTTTTEGVLADAFNFNTPPSNSRPSSLVFSSSGSASSSPRSSFALPSFVAPDNSEFRAVYNSLVALLQSSPSPPPPPAGRPLARWEAMAPAMALQIVRVTNSSLASLPDFENKLCSALLNPLHPYYQGVEQWFHSRLLTELGHRVREFKSLSGVALFSVATGGRIHGSHHIGRDRDAHTREPYDESSLDDVATRLAHLGVLHWRVWAPLAYVDDLDDDLSLDDYPMNI